MGREVLNRSNNPDKNIKVGQITLANIRTNYIVPVINDVALAGFKAQIKGTD